MIIKKGLNILCFCLLSLCISSCDLFSNQKPDPFKESEINGNSYFSSLSIKLDSSNKTVVVSYDDFESSASSLTYIKSNKVFIKEVRNEIGIVSRYDDQFYYFEVKLSDQENRNIISKLSEKIRNVTNGKDTEEVRILTGFEVTKVGLFYKQSLYNDKPASQGSYYRACAILGNNEYYYDGNSNFSLA